MPHPSVTEDAKSTSTRGRRVLVLSNPDVDSSSDDDDRRGSSTQTQPQSFHQPSSSATYRPIKPAHPTRLTTDIPPHNPTLSSPSSQSSNAVESTPPPSTPGQAVPPDIGASLFTHEDSSSVIERTEALHPNRFQKISDKIWKRRPSSNRPLEPDSLLHVRSHRSSSDLPVFTRKTFRFLLLHPVPLPQDCRRGSSWSLMIAMPTPPLT